MQRRLLRRAVVTTLALVLSAPVYAGAQGGGQPQLRTPDGKPDLSGIWQVMNNAAWNIQDQNAGPGPQGAPWLGMPASRGVVEGNEIRNQTGARPRKKENTKTQQRSNPASNSS